MLQDKVLCHQPSGTIHRLLCELIRQTGQGSFPPNYLHLGKYFHASMLTTEQCGSGWRSGKGGWEKKLKMKDLLVHGVYEVCSEVLSRVFSSLTTPVWLKNVNIVPREMRGRNRSQTSNNPNKRYQILPLTMRHFMKECSSFVRGPSVLWFLTIKWETCWGIAKKKRGVGL